MGMADHNDAALAYKTEYRKAKPGCKTSAVDTSYSRYNTNVWKMVAELVGEASEERSRSVERKANEVERTKVFHKQQYKC